MVDFDPQGLENLCQDLVRPEFRQDALQRPDQVAGRPDGAAVACRHDEGRHPAGAVHLAVEVEDPLELRRVGPVHEVGRRRASFRVHPHVQRGVVAEGKPPFRRIELV